MLRISRRSLGRAAAPSAAALVLASIVTAIVVGSGSGPVAAAPEGAAEDTVSVSGLGRVSGVPDVLRVNLGVQRTGDDVNAALNAANGDVARIKESLERHGVRDEDIQTSQLSINPHWEEDRIRGYDVFQSLTVKLRELDEAGKAISDAAAAGGNATRIEGVSFDIEDNADLIADARDAAFADARAKAEQYAELSGRSLGEVKAINESTDVVGGPIAYAEGMDLAARDAKAVPLEAGSQQVSVTSSVTWELS